MSPLCPIGYRSSAAVFGKFPQTVEVGGSSICECDYDSLRHAVEASRQHVRSDDDSRGPNILVAACVLGPNYRIEVYLYRVHWNGSSKTGGSAADYTTLTAAWEGATSLAEFARWASSTSFDILYHARTGSGLREAMYTDETDLEAVATRKTGGCICVSMTRLLSHPALPVRPPLESVELCSLLAHPVIGPLIADQGNGAVNLHVWVRIEQSLRLVAGFQELALAMKISLDSFFRTSTVKQCTNYLLHMLHDQGCVFDAGWLRANAATTVRERMADSSFPPHATTQHDEALRTADHFPKGGYFMSPVQCDTEGPVVKLDFAKFYPSIIQGFEVDFERLVPSNAPTGHICASTCTRVPIAKHTSLCLVDPCRTSTGVFVCVFYIFLFLFYYFFFYFFFILFLFFFFFCKWLVCTTAGSHCEKFHPTPETNFKIFV